MPEIISTAFQGFKTIAVGLLVLGVLVFIHELGHFIVAKLCGIRVLAFSIGMGRPLIVKRVGPTEYRLCAIPIGGYVQLAAETPGDESTGASDEFSRKPIWQRALVAVGGPAANYIAAIAFLWIVLLGGMDQPLYLDRPVVGAVADSSAAFAAGILAGDSIVSINNRPVRSWPDVQKIFALQDRRYTLTVMRNGAECTLTMDMPAVKGSQLPSDPSGGLRPCAPARIGTIMAGKPAHAAGLALGDSVVSIDNRPVHSWYEVSGIIAGFDSTAGSMRFAIMRNDTLRTIDITPAYDPAEGRFLIGIGPAAAPSRRISMSPVQAATTALVQSAEFVAATFMALKKLVMREVSPRQLFGPVGIVQMSGSVAIAEGLRSILNLMAFVGVNLAVINLLPLVVTDGGLLLYLLIEALRRRPVSARIQMTASRIAWGFFIALFIFLTFNDIARIPTLFRMFER